MRLYLITLSNINAVESDLTFAEYVNKNKFDYWRYFALNWILLTPDKISTNMLITEMVKAYGTIAFYVMEINIKDIGGVFPMNGEPPKGWTPFNWFSEIINPEFIPRWEKKSE
jgi:hypothetical protein